jgi:hypothetical protein
MGLVSWSEWTIIVAAASAYGTYYLLTEQRKKEEKDAKDFERLKIKAITPQKNYVHVGLVEGILQNLWSHSISPAASVMLKETLGGILAESLPTLKLVEFELGDAPLKLMNTTVHKVDPKTNSCQVDVDVLWDGDCKVKLKSMLGDIGVRQLKLVGRISLVLKPLTQTLPCMGGVSYCLLNRPYLHLDFTGLASVGDVSIIHKKILDAILGVVQNLLVLPYRMYNKMDVAAKLKDIYKPPIAVIRITISNGHGFKVQKSIVGKGDIPDPYVKVSLGGRTIQTTMIKNTLTPHWGEDEPLEFVVHDYDQVFTVEVWDHDKGALDSDDHLGWAEPTVKEILMSPKRSKELVLMKEKTTDEPVGTHVTLTCTMIPLSLSPVPTTPHEGKNEKNEIRGLITIVVAQAFDIPLDEKQAITKVAVTTTNGKDEGSPFETGIVQLAEGYEIDVLNPLFDCVFEIPLSYEGEQPDITLTLYQLDESFDEDKNKILGTTTVSWKDMQESPEMTLKRPLDVGSSSVTDKVPSLEFAVMLYSVPHTPAQKNRINRII